MFCRVEKFSKITRRELYQQMFFFCLRCVYKVFSIATSTLVRHYANALGVSYVMCTCSPWFALVGYLRVGVKSSSDTRVALTASGCIAGAFFPVLLACRKFSDD